MRKSLLKLLGAVAGLTLSACVSAIGMGGINVSSALGQPLKAEIELVSVKKTDKTSLVARLASPDVYRGAGLEYPYGNKFKFQIESRANGESYITVSSAQPINDPFVSMLVELTWASGKLLREYTFLLDPPGYIAEQPKPVEVQVVSPVVQSAPLETVAEPVEQTAPATAAPVETSTPASAPARRAVMAAPAKPTATEPASIATGDIAVRRGDTLSKIAMQNKPAEVSLERMLVALYRANADLFDGQNMNRIRAGKILRLPDMDELMSVSQSEAAREIRAQTADWNAYRQKLSAAASAASQSQEAQQVATGKIASSVADKAPVAEESAKEVLKLSKGEAPGDQAAGTTGKSMTAEDRKNAEQEDAIAREKSLKEEQTRAALLEKNLEDMERLAKLKSEAAALAAQPSGVAAASEVKPAPAAKPKPKVQPKPAVAPPPSLVDEILGEPLYLAGGAAILLGLGGLGVILRRRKQAAAGAGENSQNAGEITSHLATPVVPSPDTGDFTRAVTEQADDELQADDVDPIKEADLFLNFGRDAQAEEILKEALRNSPGNHQIHLKLLGIYANRKDANSFSSIARQLKDSGDSDAWQQAAAMGIKLEPGNPMYAEAASIEDTGSATMQATALDAMPDFVLDDQVEKEEPAPDVDFDLGEAEETATLSADEAEMAKAEAMDFDVTSTNPSLEAATGKMDFDVTSTSPSLSAPTDMDFDITSTNPSIPAATDEAEVGLPNLDDLVFDVTSTHPSMPAAQPQAGEPEKADQEDDGGMEFTLDFPIEDAAGEAAPAKQLSDAEFSDINLNLDDIGAPDKPDAPVEDMVAGAKDEHWHEVATKLDLAKAYQEMGDVTGAREILDEVMREGDEEQRQAAQSMLDQLG